MTTTDRQHTEALAAALTAQGIPATAENLGGNVQGIAILWPSGRDRIIASIEGEDEETGVLTWNVAAYQDGPDMDEPSLDEQAPAPTVLATVTNFYRRGE